MVINHFQLAKLFLLKCLQDNKREELATRGIPPKARSGTKAGFRTELITSEKSAMPEASRGEV